METIIKNSRQAFKWTEHQLNKLNSVLLVLDELSDYKPLTLRQIYYQLVGKGLIENNKSQYGMLSGLLKHARIDGYVSWSDIEDRVRAFHDLSGWGDAEHFVNASINQFLKGYKRDLLQTQDVYPEIWIEKDALSSLFTKVASQYTIPVVVCRGFSSVSFLNDFRERLEYHETQRPVILYFGDFDPSGLDMLKSMQITFETEMALTGIEYNHIALSLDDISEHNLPHSIEALKLSDPRAKKHIAKYGHIAVELDALSPNVLEQKIHNAINNELDMQTFDAELSEQNNELNKLNLLKEQVKTFVTKII